MTHQQKSESLLMMDTNRCIPVPIYPAPICLNADMSLHRYIPVPMCPHTDMSKHQCVPTPICQSTVVSTYWCLRIILTDNKCPSPRVD